MSISLELTRLQTGRNSIRAKLVELGIATNTDKLDALATAIEGIVNQGAVSATVQEGDTYTIPAGYHNGSGTVSGVAGGGNYSLQSKTITPTKKTQNATPDSGYYGLSDVTIAPIPDAYQDVTSVTATADDVLTGKIYVDSEGIVTTGTMANNGAVSKSLDTTTISYTIPKGFHSGSGTVKITLETKSVTPTKSAQTIKPTAGKVLSEVSVAAIPDEYQDVTGVTAGAADVITGKTIVDSTGAEIAGTMANNGELIKTLDTTTTSQTIEGGYYTGGSVKVVTESKSVTPTKATQVVNASAGKVIKSVTVNAIPAAYQDVTGVTATAGHVLDGDIFVDAEGTPVEGTMPNNGAVTKSLDTNTKEYTVPAGYHNGLGKVSITTEEKTSTPTKAEQEVVPTSGKVLSKVTVAAIPAAYQDVTGVTTVAANVLDGDYFVDKTGAKIEGTMPNNGDQSKTIDGLTATSVSIPAGYTSGGTVSLTNDIEAALAGI